MASHWNTLPVEMKLAVIDALASSPTDLDAFSKVDRQTYHLCVPAKFTTVRLSSFQLLERFLDAVPRSYFTHILSLHLTTADDPAAAPAAAPISLRTRTDSVISLLASTPRLTELSLNTEGSLDKSVIAPFPYLKNLRKLSITNTLDENVAPLSERLVVSIAGSLQNIQDLSLSNITRSHLHAADLEGDPEIPVVMNDGNIPAHPLLGNNLSLPSLLRLPTLRKLTIRDTHLGDAGWTTTDVKCRLEVLDLGSYVRSDEDANASCTARLMSALGPTVDEFSLSTALCDPQGDKYGRYNFAERGKTPLRCLRTLHISPWFPVDSVVETVTGLAGSPIETLSMRCFEEDVVDVCEALEGFLKLKLERGSGFFEKLRRIDVSVEGGDGADDDSNHGSDDSEERMRAAERLQKVCRDLRLASAVDKFLRRPSLQVRAASMGYSGPMSAIEGTSQVEMFYTEPEALPIVPAPALAPSVRAGKMRSLSI